MSSFAEMKEKRKSAIANLVAAAETTSEKQSYGDDRIWKPTVDKAGNGYAVIRFLPAPEGEDLPWVRYWDHGFKGPSGKWYIENSLTSIGQQDPVSEMNTQLWNSGIESDKQIARERKRRLHYVSNILVISDSASPENEGKVFLYKYGKKIFDKINDLMNPEFEDESPVNPFDFWKGADFKLKITRVAGFWNYDKSEFAEPSTLGGFNDKELEALWNEEHSLAAFTADDQFKSYEDLKFRLESTLKGNYTKPVDAETFGEEVESTPAPVASAPASVNEETDTLSYFAQLAKDD